MFHHRLPRGLQSQHQASDFLDELLAVHNIIWVQIFDITCNILQQAGHTWQVSRLRRQ